MIAHSKDARRSFDRKSARASGKPRSEGLTGAALESRIFGLMASNPDLVAVRSREA